MRTLKKALPPGGSTKTMAADERARSTATQAAPSTQPGRGLAPLISNYQAILQAHALYYPVAYRFVRELGRGRQGVVFLGLRQGARGCVTRHAIKVFDPSIYPNAKKYWTDMGRIAAQTSKMQTLDCPNLVAPDIYEEYNGIGYVQMGMVDGVGLRYLLDGRHIARARKRCAPEEWSRLFDVIFHDHGGKLAIQPGIAIHIMRRILRGLEVLHEFGFVHCDIKPANVMIDRLGTVRVIDYGRGAFIGEQQAFLLGTPMYMAPEQHRREPSSTAADLYAVGLMGLEMLRGEPLIKQSRPSEPDLLAAKSRLHDQLPDLLPDYVRRNEAFVGVLRKLLHPDPSKRYATAEAAEAGRGGLILVHKQLAQVGKDTEYGRELESYLSKLVDPSTGEVSTDDAV